MTVVPAVTESTALYQGGVLHEHEGWVIFFNYELRVLLSCRVLVCHVLGSISSIGKKKKLEGYIIYRRVV